MEIIKFYFVNLRVLTRSQKYFDNYEQEFYN